MRSRGRFWSIVLGGVIASTALATAGMADIYDRSADGRTLIDQAVKQAERDDKLVLVVWGANWCGWCHRLHEIMVGDTAVRKILSEEFVVTKVDLGHRDKHMDLAREYGLEFEDLGIPRLMVLDANGELVDHSRVPVENSDYSGRLLAKYLGEMVQKAEESDEGSATSSGEVEQ